MNPIKYHRSYHVPWSKGTTSDDKLLTNLNHFENLEIVMSEKMDGENTSIYTKHSHARSCTSSYHPSRNHIKQLQAQLANDIPDNLKLIGENLFAKHSIFYDNLEAYFLLFAVQNENGLILSWDETLEWAELLNLKTVPVLYRGKFDLDFVMNFHKTLDTEKQEGFVIRLADSYHIDNSNISLAKWVRENHVQTTEHWSSQAMIQNQLRK